MIKVVFFDIYGTLAKFDPPIEAVQKEACKSMGLNVTMLGIRRGYQVADAFMAKQNAESPLATLSKTDRDHFFIQYERLVLEGAGVSVTDEIILKIWKLASNKPKRLVLYKDVLPTLHSLKSLGVRIGTISNINRTLGGLLKKTQLQEQVDYWLTSSEVGVTKPHPYIFKVALETANIQPHQAIHVGDQYHSDVVGALKVGMKPLLIDRHNLLPKPSKCSKIRSVKEVLAFL